MPSVEQPPPVIDPVNRTRLAWTRTALSFAAIGGVMIKFSATAGLIILVLSLPIWAAVPRDHGTEAISSPSSPYRLRLVTGTVVIVALAALIVAIFGNSPSSLGQLLRGH
jgi:hypothetical protein